VTKDECRGGKKDGGPLIALRARIVLPLARAAIENGGVLIKGNRVMSVGKWRAVSSEATQTFDLGEVILMPGLVNAHCHLDYTDMAGLFPPPKSFTDWIKEITSTKAEWSYSEFAQSWLNGAGMLVRTGTTTVGDIETVPLLLPEVWEATPLRVLSFLEMTGVKSRRQPRSIVGEMAEWIERLASRGSNFPRCSAGLSPHAPYSTLPELLRLCAQTARRQRWRLCTHVAESALEFEMFTRGRGEMYDWLRRSERDMSDCGRGTPVEHLERHGLLRQNLLAVHVNYLGKRDAGLLAKHKVSVVHCPRSHVYFRHEAFPLRRLLRAGINVCLGTDSLASVYKRRRETVELNMFEEMRAFAAAFPWLSEKHLVQSATLNGARSLGMQGRIGQLSKGSFADAIALPFNGKISQTYAAVLGHEGDVSASMIDGQWAFPKRSEP